MCFYESEQKVDSYLATDCDGPVEDAMHAQNSRLWRVDNRCTEHGSEHAAVADGEGSSVHVFHSQFILTGLQMHHRVKCECYIRKSVTSKRKDKIIKNSTSNKKTKINCKVLPFPQASWWLSQYQQNSCPLHSGWLEPPGPVRKVILLSLLFTFRELIHCILLFITSNIKKKTETKTNKRPTSDYIIIHLRYLRSGYGHTDVNIVPVHDLFSCVVNNWKDRERFGMKTETAFMTALILPKLKMSCKHQFPFCLWHSFFPCP